jgi:hypothetical protein
MTANDIRRGLKRFNPKEHFYLHISDCEMLGTEFCWMPESQQWVGYNADEFRVFRAYVLGLILSNEDGDYSGLNALPLLATDFSGERGLWVIDFMNMPKEFPDDAEVFAIGCKGLDELKRAN